MLQVQYSNDGNLQMGFRPLITQKKKDVKEKELWLKMIRAVHEIRKDKISMMSENELVLYVKKLAKERRAKVETLKKIDDKKTAENRGYKLVHKIEPRIDDPPAYTGDDQDGDR